MGTSLAVLGAYLLAGELARHARVEEGLAAYEALFRPYVDKAQRLLPGLPRLAYPKTALGVRAFHGALSLFASSMALRRVLFARGNAAAAPAADGMVPDELGFHLPDYSAYYAPQEADTAR
jgi:2-polyprenyl-6-methoxyphenol hydroxylase-like FAD-dependent oxidoreductase